MRVADVKMEYLRQIRKENVIIAAFDLGGAEEKKGINMKKTCILLVATVVLLFVSTVLSGCGCVPPAFGDRGCAQSGETKEEGNRRHIRNARINQEGLMRDIDVFMLYDEPSPLTDKKIP